MSENGYLDQWKSTSYSSELSLLYPPCDGSRIPLVKSKSVVDHVIEYVASDVKPYVAVVDLNNSDDSLEENRPKPAIEIGVEFKF